MCGIVGINCPNSGLYIENMLSSIKHRGPDDSGIYFHKNLSLGHVRLSIQELSYAGHQPMVSDSKRFVLLFNGEIYNHLDIRKELLSSHIFNSQSDTETILIAYQKFGTEIFNKLIGIFAIVIYDTEKNEIIIARDHFGVKPMYLYHSNETFIFGSEIKSFLHFPNFNKNLSYKALLNYISLLWSPGELTPFENVKKLLPGHYAIYSCEKNKILNIYKYYEINFNKIKFKYVETDLLNLLDIKLTKAVERQLLSDVPIAFFLSGGLDSSSILAIAKKLRPLERFKCYTTKIINSSDIQFDSDLYYARKVATFLNLDLVEVEMDLNSIADFDKLIYHLDEPQADLAPLHVYNICKQAEKDGFKVLIGGVAGDDLFTGYRRHSILYFHKYFNFLPRLFYQLIIDFIKFTKITNKYITKLNTISKIYSNKGFIKFFKLFEWLSYDIAINLFNKNSQIKISNYRPSDYFKNIEKDIPFEKNLINKILFWEMKTFLVDHNLNYTDKLSMACGVEVRVPFLDQELVEFSTKLPPSMKLNNKTTKYILKKLMEKYLPNDIIYRKKIGFGAPVEDLIKNKFAKKINEYLSIKKIEERNIFNQLAIFNLIKRNKALKVNASYSILALLAIESWIRQFYDEN